jgi:hypothetical protein
MAEVNASTVIEAFVLLRDKRSELKKEFAAADKILEEKQDRLDAWLLKAMETTGSDQLACKGVGTAFRQMSTKMSCTDWTSFWPKIGELGRYDFLEKRLSAKAIQEFLDDPANKGVVLPGITTFNEYKVVVRRA